MHFKFSAILLLLLSLYSCFGVSTMSLSTNGGEHLSYNRKNLHEIPQEVFLTDNLTSLSLFGNHFTNLTDSISKLTELEVLYLGKNDFERFPEEVCYLKKLRILSLAYNNFDSLPSCIGQLSKLETLIVNNNKINFIPDSISSLQR